MRSQPDQLRISMPARRYPPSSVLLQQREAISLVSRPEEFHPKPLAEPCVNLSIYTAPIIQPDIW